MTVEAVAASVRRVFGMVLDAAEADRLYVLVQDTDLEAFPAEGRDVVTGLPRRVIVRRDDLGPPDGLLPAVFR